MIFGWFGFQVYFFVLFLFCLQFGLDFCLYFVFGFVCVSILVWIDVMLLGLGFGLDAYWYFCVIY